MARKILGVWLGIWLLIIHLVAQTDTSITADFRKLDIFPAISYAPETSLTLGAIGIRYFRWGENSPVTPLSNLEFLGVYTLRKQIIVETRWEIFTREGRWRSRGEAFFNRYPDRNYGPGNDARMLIVEYEASTPVDTLNYVNFNSDRIKFSPVLMRRIRPHLYLGAQYDMEYLYRMDITSEPYRYLTADSLQQQSMPVQGLRSGLGVQLLYDDRDYLLNPLRGSFLEFNLLHYNRLWGSDYQFTMVSTDARHYWNPVLNHTLALRSTIAFELADDPIPMRALSRVGGHKFMRGYFKGTYQDHHMAAFELEYRCPLWSEGTDAPLWQVWKRLGVVAFLGGAQVAHDLSGWQWDRFNLAAGGGLRILFNPESRVNIRIDYAIALRDHSDGPGKRQHGFYFYLGEAF